MFLIMANCVHPHQTSEGGFHTAMMAKNFHQSKNSTGQLNQHLIKRSYIKFCKLIQQFMHKNVKGDTVCQHTNYNTVTVDFILN